LFLRKGLAEAVVGEQVRAAPAERQVPVAHKDQAERAQEWDKPVQEA
jgi:hypothetical protein